MIDIADLLPTCAIRALILLPCIPLLSVAATGQHRAAAFDMGIGDDPDAILYMLAYFLAG